MSRHERTKAAAEGMRSFWDAKARENPMYYIDSQLDYAHIDEQEFWSSGRETLHRTLGLFGLTIGRDDHVVEIGCGIGRMTRAIAERAGSVVGIDVSAEMVKQARSALADLDNVTIELGNGRDLAGLPDARADVVYSFIVFQHIPDPEITCQYIRDIGRVLRPGGWTSFQISQSPELHRPEKWVTEKNLGSRLRRFVRSGPRGMLAPQWLGSALSSAKLQEALDEGGLTLDSTVGEDTQFCLVLAHRPTVAG